ncbi:MAG: CxxC-x17-CxxC domain-containing protein [Candidatus Kariarchaeaceae archaeon]|jgi:CxxC-x17-CxxC domain-containing protein
MSYNRDNRRGGGFRGPPREREMHDVVCAECNKETQVPFKPDGERPVYCQDCFRARRPQRY